MDKITELEAKCRYLFEGIDGHLIEGLVMEVSKTAYRIKWQSGNVTWEPRHRFSADWPVLFYRPTEKLN